LLSRGTSLLREQIGDISIIPGIAEMIPELRKTTQTMGILTSNSIENVNLFLETQGLRGSFNFVSSTSKLTGKSKHLRAIRKTFSLRHEEMLYVGDEIRDVKASHKAGIDCAAVTWGFNSRDSLTAAEPKHILDEPVQLLEVRRIS
jgi:phosphoglycolate phosphatase